MGVLFRAKLDRGRDLCDHQLVGEIAVVVLRRWRGSALAQEADRAVVELVDEWPMIGARALALLVRSREIEIRLAGQKIESPGQRLEVAANESADVVAGQAAVAGEKL